MPRTTSETDISLLDASRHGDPEAFGIFYTRHRESLLGFLASKTGNPEVAVDLMGETFARALVDVLDSAKPLPEAPVPWLFLIAKNLFIDGQRRGVVDAAARQKLGLERLDLEDSDLERVIEIAARSDLEHELKDILSPTEWKAFEAYVLDEEPYEHIARRMECSEAVARKRVSRAKSRIRTAIGGNRA